MESKDREQVPGGGEDNEEESDFGLPEFEMPAEQAGRELSSGHQDKKVCRGM